MVRLGAIGTALLLVVLFTVSRSRAAFTTTTANTGNSLATGTVVLTDDDTGSAMFSVTGMSPGTPVSECIAVSYAGSLLPAPVRLYGSTTGALDTYLDTTIEVGTGGSSATCTGFVASSTPFTGTLEAFSATNLDWASGLSVFTAAANPTSRTVRITFAVQNDPAAQGLSSTVDFVFESQA